MKKLLTILGAITLIGTTSTTVIGCENKIDVTQKINNVIKNQSLGDINTGILTMPTAQKIKFVLKKQNPNLDINAIFITNITNENANVTGDNKTYSGTINVNYSCLIITKKINFELNELPKKLIITNTMNGLEVLTAIRSAIVNLSNNGYISNEELKSDQTLLWSAWISDSDWDYQQIWSNSNLQKYNNGNIIIKININTDNLYFEQTTVWKEIKINIKTNLNILVDNITINDIKVNDINSFINKLVISFRKQSEFNNLKKDDIDLFKKDTTIILDNNDIVANSNLEITVKAKKSSLLFTGNKNIKVNLIVNKTDLKTKITTLTTDITANLYEPYWKLKPIISNAPEIKNLSPQLYLVDIGFYKDVYANDRLDTDDTQKAGTIYIIISASDNDANYQEIQTL